MAHSVIRRKRSSFKRRTTSPGLLALIEEEERYFSIEYTNAEIISDKGAGGRTMRVTRRCDGELVAVREVVCATTTKKKLKLALEEATHLSKLNHPNFVEMYTVFYDRDHKSIFFEIEHYPPGASLEVRIISRQKNQKSFDESDIIELFRQVVTAVKFLHDHCVTHGSVKAKNVFITPSGTVKLTDFVVSRLRLTNTNPLTCPSAFDFLKFMPPEFFDGKMPSKIDSWMTGLLLYQLLTLRLPFDYCECKTVTDIAKVISTQAIEPISPSYSKDLSLLVYELLQRDESKRLPIVDVCARRMFAPHFAKRLSENVLEEIIEAYPELFNQDNDEENKKPKKHSLVQR